jgi:predicted transcriptional regulator
MQGLTGVNEVMSTPVLTAKSDQTLEEVAHHFEAVSTLPVVDGNLICIGVISKNDQAKASHGLQTRIGEMMSSPAITLSEDQTVMGKYSLQQFDLPLKISSICTRKFFVSRVIK